VDSFELRKGQHPRGGILQKESCLTGPLGGKNYHWKYGDERSVGEALGAAGSYRTREVPGRLHVEKGGETETRKKNKPKRSVWGGKRGNTRTMKNHGTKRTVEFVYRKKGRVVFTRGKWQQQLNIPGSMEYGSKKKKVRWLRKSLREANFQG